jgi:hypothetical protein
MRHKEFTLNKIDSVKVRIETLKRQIESNQISAIDAINVLNFLMKELEFIYERLELESNE